MRPIKNPLETKLRIPVRLVRDLLPNIEFLRCIEEQSATLRTST
jgi:hypothetical protein